MMVTTIGWINIVFIAIMGSIYPIKLTYMKKYKNEGKEKAKNLGKLYQFSRKAHPITGIAIILLGLYHGSKAYSLSVLHTGTILLYLIILMAIVAVVGQKVKPFKKNWRILHGRLGILVYIFAILHVFWRNII